MNSIGPYRLDSELGRGAMGVVFRGFDPAIGRAVAIKIIQLNQFATAHEKAELKLRFAREAAAAGKLSHPNIVTVYQLGEQGDLQYLALELVEGWSLEKALSNGIPQDRRAAISILSQVAGALDYAHGEGIIHRDVKPANILVRPDGKVKLTDFGIARISSQTITKTGSSMGTPAYMAPEQIMSARVTGRADQFSLAVIAYQMLSGRKPFVADTDPGLIFKIVSEEAQPLHEIDRSFPPRASEVLRKGLAKDPEQRFATCAEFIGALSDSLEARAAAGPVAAPAPAPKAGRASKRVPGWVIALAAAAVVTAVLLAAFGFFKRTAQGTAEVPAAPAAAPSSAGRATERRPDVPASAPAQRRVDVTSSPAVTPPAAAKPAPPPAPVVAQFTAEPVSIQRGQSSTLHWQVNGRATSISIDPGIGAVQNNGSRRVAPSESAAYTLTATGPGGTAKYSVSVGVGAPPPPPPVVTQFTAEPGTIQRGQSSTLHWQVNGNATSTSIDPGVGAVQNGGSRRVTPGESTTYTLTASGPGGTATASAAMAVTAPPPPGPRAGDSKVNSRDGLKYLWIPPGAFTMGCSSGDSECYDLEKPAHEVTSSKGFWLGRTDVTQAAYQRVMGSNPNINHFKGNDLPVDSVTWDEARSYCQAIGGRLPTEAEWEYAARAGSTAARYGNLDDIAWYSSNSGSKTHDVGQKQANAFGLYDMLGNVWQWTADWYGDYPAGNMRDPAGPASGTLRTLRGGSWFNSPRVARVSNRVGLEPGNRSNYFGFRCVGE